MKFGKTLTALLCSIAVATPAYAEIYIVGSSTVYPFATLVAERFNQVIGLAAPKVEATGTGGGMKLVCEGVGGKSADIANASRRIKQSEINLCDSNGAGKLIEVKIGYDGIVFANSLETAPISLSRSELFAALARNLPDANGELSPNPNLTWQDVNQSLLAVKIEVYGPPPTSGTRDAFVELVMEEGCKDFPGMAALKAIAEARYEAACAEIREDGAFIEAGENDNLIIRRLISNENSYGIFGYSFLEENIDGVRGIMIDGVEPTFESIADGTYPIARPLYFYVKQAHLEQKEELTSFVEFFISDDVAGEDGFLSEAGLIPLDSQELTQYRADVNSRKAIEL